MADFDDEDSPEREPLRFSYDRSSVSPEMAEVMDNIKKLAETMLYHWKTFPIKLPQSVTGTKNRMSSVTGGNGQEKVVIDFRNLIIGPTFDELEQVSKNPAGNLKQLNEKQLNSIWNNGEFEVDSINFPGQTHRWRLTQFLQKGSVRAHNTLLDDCALALRILIITAKNRFCSHFFSLSESIKSCGLGLWKILDIIIGMPSTSPGDLQSKIQGEHMRYLVAELIVKSIFRKNFFKFCTFVLKKCHLPKSEIYKIQDVRPPPIPYIYQTPTGTDIDLRLWNRDLINNCLPILSNILEKEARGWFIPFRQKLVRDLKGEGLSKEELLKQVNEDVMKEYLRRVFSAIIHNVELENLQPGIGQLLVNQAKSVLAMQKATMKMQQKLQKHKTELQTHLKKRYPVKSRIGAWENKQLSAFEHEFSEQNLWSAHEEAISLCEEEDLHQSIYFLKRDLNFIKEREPVLLKELSRVKIPNKVFTFNTRIWFPSNWVVTRVYEEETEVIPTVLAAKGQTAPTPSLSKQNKAAYLVEKYLNQKTTTRYPCWRWWNYLYRTWSWMWNAMFVFGVVIPWCSPLSLRALFYLDPFVPDLKISQEDGVLYPDESSRTHTLLSRLRALWSNVFSARKKFEETADTGFLGKSCTRHFNRVWNYVLKGALGSVLLVTVFPVLCVTFSGISLAAAITTPVWIPLVTLGAHLIAFVIYDFDCPDDNSNKVGILFEALVWRLLIQGCMQPLAALMVGCIGCPLAALGVSIFGALRRSVRGLWDTFMFYAVIKPRGRVPMSDGFVARRVAGPGLASNYFLQIHPEQTLAAVEARMELDELEVFRVNTVKQIEQPVQEYRSFVSSCFKPFSAGLITEGVFNRLKEETAEYDTHLTQKVNEKANVLRISLHPEVQGKIKLPERELKITILQTAKMLEKFYPDHVIKPSGVKEEDFWEDKLLEYKDWRGLASRMLSEIFSPSFLVPLEETDTHFQLQVNHLNLKKYVAMLNSTDFQDDLDLVTEIHTPQGDVQARAPHLDAAYFNPDQKIMPTSRFFTPRGRRFPWKPVNDEVYFDKLEIPLPIPHPAFIAVSIYNRENDQEPIDFSNVYCQQLIRAAKELPYVDIRDMEEVDLESNTPDNGIEPVTVISHLAEQEQSFSDDTAAVSPSSPTQPTVFFEHRINVYVDDVDDSEGRIVYKEQEADNSCILNMASEDETR
ncbi:hypothetical protein ACJMK2_035151 [Sinanodonta woodiana]|uniref:Uncharacterized protein n=1 Tax=Sinanodonta woodiana TaxID=1069815 RepID=A0ABD3WTY5_SINWO